MENPGKAARKPRVWVAIPLCLALLQWVHASENPDYAAVLAVRGQLAKIEQTFTAYSQRLLSLSNQIALASRQPRSKADKEAFNRDFREALQGLYGSLDAADKVSVPRFSSATVRQEIASAIEFHKQWAALEREKFAAFFNDHPDIERAKSLGEAADQIADQEATSLAMASVEVGLTK